MESAYFVVTRRRKTCLLAPPQHGGARFPTLTPLFWGVRAHAYAPGVSDGTRTRDILDHNQVLYHLSYTHHATAREPVPRATLRSVKCTGRRLRAGSQFSLGTAPVRAP